MAYVRTDQAASTEQDQSSEGLQTEDVLFQQDYENI